MPRIAPERIKIMQLQISKFSGVGPLYPPPIPSPGVDYANAEDTSTFCCQPAEWLPQPAGHFLSYNPAQCSEHV